VPPPEGNQRSDANFGLIALGGGALLVMLVVAVVAVTSLQSALSGVAPSFVAQAGVTALATPVAPPGVSALEVVSGQGFQAYRAGVEQRLNSYHWVNREAGVVAIPIERAIDLLVQRGVPTRAEAADAVTTAPSRASSGRVSEGTPP
jgi:hypothetical protein